MTDDDRPAFVAAFTRLALAFRFKMRSADLDQLSADYFAALSSYPLHDVLAVANDSKRTFRRFPKILDLLETLDRAKVGAPADVRIMSTVEASEYVRAERLHYEDQPCTCLLCRAAGTTRPIRFVPDVTDDDRDERAFCPPKNRIVVTGHWAHGDELARWYAARDHFFGAASQAGVNTTMLRRYGFVYTPPPTAPREPGMEG